MEPYTAPRFLLAKFILLSTCQEPQEKISPHGASRALSKHFIAASGFPKRLPREDSGHFWLQECPEALALAPSSLRLDSPKVRARALNRPSSKRQQAHGLSFQMCPGQGFEGHTPLENDLNRRSRAQDSLQVLAEQPRSGLATGEPLAERHRHANIPRKELTHC